MRTLLAAFSLVMLVGAGMGCGDDSTSNSGNDLAVTADMAAPVVHDMSTLNCLQIFICVSNNMTATGLQQCVSEGKAVSQQKAGALLQCANTACNGNDAGASCLGSVITQALGLAGGSPSGPCATEGGACASDTGM